MLEDGCYQAYQERTTDCKRIGYMEVKSVKDERGQNHFVYLTDPFRLFLSNLFNSTFPSTTHMVNYATQVGVVVF